MTSPLRPSIPLSAFAIVVGLALLAPGARAAPPSANSAAQAVVRIEAQVPADARTAAFLGTRRVGNGVVIDAAGLILTVGYLVVEAMAVEITDSAGQRANAKVLAYDHDSGLGLLRAQPAPAVIAVALGRAEPLEVRDRIYIASHGAAAPIEAVVVSRRTFAGPWEYLLERPIFTIPPILDFGGAAALGADGRLLGIGSLFVRDAYPGETPLPGNMFVPIDLLGPILADLIEQGRPSTPPRPWLGVRSQELLGRLFVTGVVPTAPAEAAGIALGDLILAVGGQPIVDMADFYRKVWGLGSAGIDVPLRILKGNEVRDITVRSANRYDWLKINPSF